MNARIEAMNDDYHDDLFTKEIIDGKIYLMAPPSKKHRLVQANLLKMFNDYFGRNKKKCAAVFEVEFYIDDENYFEPDVLIYCRDNNEKKGRKLPVIIIEVLSGSTWKKDMTVKMIKYAGAGIEEYWTVDYRSQILNIYKLKDGEYYWHETYNYPIEEELSSVREAREKELSEAVKEFSPVSFPDMPILLEEVFSFGALDII